MPADMYDAMDTDLAVGDEPDAAEEEEVSGLDAEFQMHAEKAGFDTPEKAEALKDAIERCIQLKSEGDYTPPADDAEGEMPEDLDA